VGSETEIFRSTRNIEENVERVRESWVRSRKKSNDRQSLELGIPKTTIQNVIYKHLRLYAYKIQLKHEIKPDDRPQSYDFVSLMLNKIDDDNDGTFLCQICFIDEASFHMNGCVIRYNCRIWGSVQPNEIREYVRGSAKVNAWCGLLCDRVVGSFLFGDGTVTGGIYQDMLENILDLPHLRDGMTGAIATADLTRDRMSSRYLPSDK
jgi:hypothetical protein